jgi:hypothetical protein
MQNYTLYDILMRIGKLGKHLQASSGLNVMNLPFLLLCRKGVEILEAKKPEPLQNQVGVPNSVDT